MAITFMAILAVAVEERVSAKAGAILLWPLLALAVFSLLLWRWTDDLRLYGWVQFFPCIAFIRQIVRVLRPGNLFGWIHPSGHTLKHFAAASACLAILRYFQIRRPVS